MRPSTSTSRRAATALAIVTLAGLATGTPAFARQDPGPAVSQSENHRGVGATTDENRTSREQMNPKASVGPSVAFIDDEAVEYVQIALGALGGVALMGAAAAGVSATHRRHAAHPA